MARLNYTTVNHIARKEMKLSLMEYCLVDLIYHLASRPGSRHPGWSYATRRKIAAILDVTERHVHNLMKTLIDRKILEQEKEHPKWLRATDLWYQKSIAQIDGDEDVENMNKVPVLEADENRNSVHTKPEQTSGLNRNRLPVSTIDSNNDKNKTYAPKGAGGELKPYVLKPDPDCQLVYAFKTYEVVLENRDWDAQHFARVRKRAKVLYERCGGDLATAKACLKDLAEYFKRKALSFTFETILDYQPKWKDKQDRKQAQVRQEKAQEEARRRKDRQEAAARAQEAGALQGDLFKIKALPVDEMEWIRDTAKVRLDRLKFMSEALKREGLELEMVQVWRELRNESKQEAVTA